MFPVWQSRRTIREAAAAVAAAAAEAEAKQTDQTDTLTVTADNVSVQPHKLMRWTRILSPQSNSYLLPKPR
jgi:threonine dehydratase